MTGSGSHGCSLPDSHSLSPSLPQTFSRPYFTQFDYFHRAARMGSLIASRVILLLPWLFPPDFEATGFIGFDLSVKQSTFYCICFTSGNEFLSMAASGYLL